MLWMTTIAVTGALHFVFFYLLSYLLFFIWSRKTSDDWFCCQSKTPAELVYRYQCPAHTNIYTNNTLTKSCCFHLMCLRQVCVGNSHSFLYSDTQNTLWTPAGTSLRLLCVNIRVWLILCRALLVPFDNGQYDEPWIRESSPCRVIMEDDNRLSIKCILVCILHQDFLFCHFDIAWSSVQFYLNQSQCFCSAGNCGTRIKTLRT